MVFVSAPGGAGYCIDDAEVTNAGYNAFLSTNPSTTNQPPYCSWNNTFAPSHVPGGTLGAYPVVNIDWCDAFRFCSWSGKHLCGAISGGANAIASETDASKSEWFNACSNKGAQTYPYTGGYNASACVGEDYDGAPGFQANTDILRPVKAASACVGGFAGIHDMSGNAREWVDACTAYVGAGDNCRVRGGSFHDGASGLTCSVSDARNRKDNDDQTGFRCCY
jgi:formylglycine-generating enzyme required for sulfatase activity